MAFLEAISLSKANMAQVLIIIAFAERTPD
jgi:hypothetical protein